MAKIIRPTVTVTMKVEKEFIFDLCKAGNSVTLYVNGNPLLEIGDDGDIGVNSYDLFSGEFNK